MDDSTLEGLALVFQERFWADHDAGTLQPLGSYLELFPGHDELIASEYLAALAQARGDDDEPSSENVGDGQIGPYRLIEEIGRGGQGVVWLAKDVRLGRRVALKVLTGLGPGADSHLARFKREAAVAAKLDHPGICGVHDAGIEGGVPFIAMRYVDGETLADGLARRKQKLSADESSSFLPFDEGQEEKEPESKPTSSSSIDRPELDRLLAGFEKVAAALHAAHEVGIVHRDLKPGNIMVSSAGEPVILDFGMARDDSEDAGPSLTMTGDLFGTPAYMSPEQITGRRVKVDHRSDIYSLGVTLYECLVMKRPFEAPTRESLYQAIMSKEPLPVRKHDRHIPSDLEVVIQCAMDKDRDRRYQTAADMAEDLRRVRENEPVLARKVSIPGRAWRWSKRRPTVAALLCVLALGAPALSVLGTWYWVHRGDVAKQEQRRIAKLVEAQLDIGFFEIYHGNTSTARAAFEEAIAIDDTSTEAWAGLVRSHLFAERDPAEALRVLDRANEHVPNPQILARTRAEILSSLGREAEAAAVLREAPPIEGSLMWFLEGLRSLHAGHVVAPSAQSEAMSHYARAAVMLRRAISASPAPRRGYHLSLAHALGHLEEYADSAIVADVLQQLWPQSAASWAWSGFATQNTDPLRAEEAFRTSTALDPTSVNSRTLFAKFLFSQGREQESTCEYREVLRLSPDDAQAHQNLGLMLLDSAPDEALEHLGKAIGLDPRATPATLGLSLLLERRGEHEEAIGVLRKAMAVEPAPVHIELASLFLRIGRNSDAETAFRDAIQRNPTSASAYHGLGSALARLGRRTEAVEAFRKAKELDPDHADARTALTGNLWSLGKRDEVFGLYREWIEEKPDDARLHLMLGSLLAMSGRLDEAIPSLKTAVRLDPDHWHARADLGRCLALLEKWDEALPLISESLRQGRENHPDTEEPARAALLSLLKKGVIAKVRHLEAEDELEEAIALIERHSDLIGEDVRIKAHLERLKRDL